ncbi:GMC family oxidoreductase N-terminal domain-containing protein [Paraburkholderia phosphatilytica]|uniref:GMC family oxidoreductase N-terminal domain-containing protein n=1 Tax=Paraburkholderia phosphatilytica TaxID=2282883 RepID=UPI000E474665|nr:GMC family oxidoreductase N-terminal domain-containing protein [Paraburkholderia phosphatilytica]
MNRLSSALGAMQPHYDVVVVGSGYGGAIAASRMARAGKRVCVIERGREFMAGEFPATQLEGARNVQYNTELAQVGSPLALLEVHMNPDVAVVVGCGLGGTSLINANVALHPDKRLWDDPRWPAAIRADQAGLEDGYRRATTMLSPSPVPAGFPDLPKLDALAASAQALGMERSFYRPPITVTFQDGPNAAGVDQQACIGCGDCNSGCNHGAKNSTHMNYLPDAVAHGAQIFTEVAVHSVLKSEDGASWRVRYTPVEFGRDIFRAPDLEVGADVVILSAGTLGSTAILLRSRDAGLPVSSQLGRHFTGNGDVLSFTFNTDHDINGVGWGTHRPGEIPPVGPTICGIIDHRDTPNVTDGFVIEEGSLASPVGTALMGVLGLAAPVEGVPIPDPAARNDDPLDADARIAESVLRGPHYGAMRNTQTYLVMAHDDESGEVSVKDGRARVSWPNAGKQPVYAAIEKTLETATTALGGEYVRNPISTKLLGDKVVTVHPLGGCGMGEDAEHGVVDADSRVFSGVAGNAAHDGLYVMDGSVVPLSLGVNPLLTISALAERNCARLAQARGWAIDYDARGTAQPPAPPAIGLRFTETMVGDYTPAGGAASHMEFTLTVTADDLAKLIADPEHPATMVGTLTCAALSGTPLQIADGRFNLFTDDPTQVERRDMNYHMTLIADEGPRYRFFGQKTITRSSPVELWAQTNTLYVELREDRDDAPLLGSATLIITPENFLRQMRTMEVTNAPDLRTRLDWQLKFGRFFTGVLLDEYGGIAAPLQYFDPSAAPRLRRTLRAPAPTVGVCETRDGKTLRLTRYQGGDKGPVLLIHGSGVSSRIFSTDLIGTNLVEYLCAARYDVWLVDLRVSIALPTALEQTNADLVAREDIPAAVAKVLEVTKKPSLQVVAHCFGSVALTMSLLADLKGVRSAVMSQVSAHLRPPLAARIKAGLHMPGVLDLLGVRDLTAYTQHARWPHNLLDDALRLLPVGRLEGCDSAVCHRATFMYGLPYRHARLDDTLHRNLQELFGVHDITLFEHLATMVRAGHVTDVDGNEVYMPHLDRLRLPIAFIHGEQNEVYVPESTQETYDALVALHGADLYERHVVDGYGHIDCIFGKTADVDVYPLIVRHLDAH